MFGNGRRFAAKLRDHDDEIDDLGERLDDVQRLLVGRTVASDERIVFGPDPERTVAAFIRDHSQQGDSIQAVLDLDPAADCPLIREVRELRRRFDRLENVVRDIAEHIEKQGEARKRLGEAAERCGRHYRESLPAEPEVDGDEW